MFTLWAMLPPDLHVDRPCHKAAGQWCLDAARKAWFLIRRCAHLAGDGGDDGLGVDQAGVAQVVQAIAGEDLGTGLEPHGLAELRSIAQRS
jgi:hypothetical protein